MHGRGNMRLEWSPVGNSKKPCKLGIEFALYHGTARSLKIFKQQDSDIVTLVW